MSSKIDGLPAKWRRFAEEYLIDFCGARAAVRAGYAESSAKVTACNLLKDPKVWAYINQFREEQSKRLKITADTIMMDLETLCREAVAAGQFGPAVRAKELQGKRLGIFIDVTRTETHTTVNVMAAVKVIAGGDPSLERRLLEAFPLMPNELAKLIGPPASNDAVRRGRS